MDDRSKSVLITGAMIISADLAYAENGSYLEVDTPEGRRELEVTDLPFLDKHKSIPRRSLRS